MLLCCTVATAHDFEVDGIYYNIISSTDKTVAVTYRGSSYDYYDEYIGYVTIPSVVTYNGTTYSVTSIGEYAFYKCYNLESIVIPSCVTSIGNFALYATGLRDVVFCDKSKCVSIGNYAFGVSNFESIVIPNSVTSIGDCAFVACTELTSIVIPNRVRSIGKKAFQSCPKLKRVINFSSLTIEQGSTTHGYVGYYANVVIKIPYSSISIVGDFVFSKIGDENKLYAYLGNGSGNGSDIVLPNNYKGESYAIGDDVFYGCTELTSVIIPSSVTSIGERAFYGCTGLKRVINFSSLTIEQGKTTHGYVGYYATDVIDDTNYSIEGDFLFSEIDGEFILSWYVGAGVNVVLPDNYKGESYTIGERAFNGCTGLESVEIPNGVIAIGNYAFSGCSSLKSVTIPSSVLAMQRKSLPSGVIKVIFLGNTPPRLPSDKIYRPTANMIYVSNRSVYGYGTEYPQLSSMFEVGGVKYVITSAKERTCDVIDCCYDSRAANVAVDSVVTYRNIKLTVKNINDYALYKNNHIKQAYVNNDGNVGTDAFYDCDSIAGDVTIENNGDIGLYAFYDCDGISGNLTVSNNGNIGEYAFYDCDGTIEYAKISNNGDIGEYAFYDCDGFSGNLTVSNNGNIGEYAFYDCDGTIEYAKISNNGNIGEYAFSHCNGILGNLTVSNDGNIGEYAFYGCVGMESVDITSNGDIYSNAFQDCTSLLTANVMNSGSIGSYAFEGCTTLENLVLGENVGSLGGYAFSRCSSLKEYEVPDWIPSMGEYCFSNCISLKKMVVGTGIEQLRAGTFKDCSSLQDMTIGVNVDSIDAKVFYNCTSLPVINIPQATKHVGDSVFFECGSLATVVFENRADSIVLGSNGESPMFSSCPLDSVYIGGRLQYSTRNDKGYSPFYGNRYLRSVTYNDVETTVYDKEYMNCTNLQNVHLGNGLKKIGAEAFRNCTALPRIKTPDSVYTMGEYTFAGCSSLKNVVIGNGTQAVNKSTFRDCTSLVDVKLGGKVASVGASAFKNCTSLPLIRIPAATTSIADSVFNNCVSLKNFFAEDGDKTLTLGKNAKNANGGQIGDNCPLFIDCQLDSIYLGRNLSYNQTQEFGYSPFYFNKTLRAVVIGDKVKSVFPNEFYQCKKLYYVSVGNGVTSVGDWAFSGCISLDHFSFGTGLQTIGTEAFSDCTAVTKIVSSCDVPPVCGDQALADINVWDCTLYVPEEYIDAYYFADQWCDFFFIEGAEYNLRFIVDGEVYVENRVKYNQEIELPADPVKEGYTFLGWRYDGAELPERMPAADTEFNALFKANDYTLTYIVDGDVYETVTVACDSEITPVDAPEKDGYTFSHWEGLPATMPAGNMEVTAVYNEIPTSVTITIGAHGSTTYCSQYALDFSNVEGLNAYAATGYNINTGVITMTRVMTTNAATGLYLKAAQGTYVVPIIDSADDFSLNMLAGVLEKTLVKDVSEDGVYANYRYVRPAGETEYMFYRSTAEGANVSAGKAYLQIPLEWLPLSPMESVQLRFDDGETTGIEEVEGDGKTESSIIYDMSGRVVINPVKGIYIVNGKKIVIK